MNRIDSKFSDLKKAGRKALVGYLTAGDPDIHGSEKDIRQALDHGVDILEIGVPFSDPTADGPVIQAASQRALAHGMNVGKALDLVRIIRKDYDQPIILFGYINPFFRYGYAELCNDARMAGVDGFLVVDLSHEESAELEPHLEKNGLYLIRLVAPTTPIERMKVILKNAKGFVYYIMVTGVTGERSKVASNIHARIADIRKSTKVPVAAGFGVGSCDQARKVAAVADAVVVGSALVSAARERKLSKLVREIRSGIDSVKE